MHWDRHDPDHPQQIGTPFQLSQPASYVPMIVRLSGDGRLLAASSNAYQDEAKTTVWDVAQQRQLQVLDGSPDAFESDNTTLVLTTTPDNQIVFKDARSGLDRRQPLTGLTGPGPAVISRDGGRLAVDDSTFPSNIKIFDLATGNVTSVLDSGAIAVAFLSDGRLLTSDQDHAEILDVDATAGPLATTLGDAPDDTVQARYTRNGTGVWSLGLGPASRSSFWDADTGRSLAVSVPEDAILDDVESRRAPRRSRAAGRIGRAVRSLVGSASRLPGK